MNTTTITVDDDDVGKRFAIYYVLKAELGFYNKRVDKELFLVRVRAVGDLLSSSRSSWDIVD